MFSRAKRHLYWWLFAIHRYGTCVCYYKCYYRYRPERELQIIINTMKNRTRHLGLAYDQALWRRAKRDPITYWLYAITLLALLGLCTHYLWEVTTPVYEKDQSAYVIPDVCDLATVECDTPETIYVQGEPSQYILKRAYENGQRVVVFE